MAFYITTAINYVNGVPHLGHAYEAITTDVLARHHRQRGEDVFFLTGTDEHGEPVADAAHALGVEPLQLADKNAELIAGVFAELKAARPEGVRYLSLRLDDDSFIHVVETEADDGASAIPGLSAFKAFQSGIRERCLEPPQLGGFRIVGNYRMLDEP